MKKQGIKPEVMLHLDPGHKVLWVLDAPTSEAARDMVYDAGLQQWNDFQFYMACSLEWLTELVRKNPAIWE